MAKLLLLPGRSMPAVALLLILVACGGGSAATQGPAGATPTQPSATAAGVPTLAPTAAATAGAVGGLQACDYLTPDDLTNTAGFPPHLLPVPSDDELYSYCTFGGAGGGGVKIWVSKSPETSRGVFNTMKINKGEAVTGVGDEAYWSTDSFQPGLYFMKGGLLAYISGDQTGPEDNIIALGKLLATRMAEG